MSEGSEVGDTLVAAARVMAGLSLPEQRRLILLLLRQLDEQAVSEDAFAAMLLELTTDIRQRVAMRRW